MANINRVVLVGNLTRTPSCGTRRAARPSASCASPSTRAARTTRPASGREKPNYFDVTVWGNQGESCAQYLSKGRPVGDRRPPRVARVGGAGRHQAPGGRDHRRQRPVPRQPRRRRAAAQPQFVPARRGRPRTPTSAGRPPTTTSRSRMATAQPRASEEQSSSARRPAAASGPAAPAQLLLLPGEDRGGRLQEHQPAPALHLREGQDPLAPDHRRLPPPPGAGRGRGQAGARDGAPALRREQLAWRSSSSRTSRRSACAARSSTSRAATRATSCCRASWPSRRRPRRVAELREARRRSAPATRRRAFEQAQEIAAACSSRPSSASTSRPGRPGSLFGSVTPTDIADEIWRDAQGPRRPPQDRPRRADQADRPLRRCRSSSSTT